jgi:hypothetical protein
MTTLEEFEEFMYKCICRITNLEYDSTILKCNIINNFFHDLNISESQPTNNKMYNYYLLDEESCVEQMYNYLFSSDEFYGADCYIDYDQIKKLNENVQKVFLWHFYLNGNIRYSNMLSCPHYIATFADFVTIMETTWLMKHNANPLRSIFNTSMCDEIEIDIVTMSVKESNDEDSRIKAIHDKVEQNRADRLKIARDKVEQNRVDRLMKEQLKISDPHMYYTQYGITVIEKNAVKRTLDNNLINALDNYKKLIKNSEYVHASNSEIVDALNNFKMKMEQLDEYKKN